MKRIEYLKQELAKAANRRQRAHATLKSAIGRYEASLEAVTRRERALWQMTDQPLVRVRPTGAEYAAVYHSSSHGCSRLRTTYSEMFEAEAQANGLKRCTACSWPASMEAVA